MDIETLKTEVNTEVQERAEELAKDKIRSLTLAKKRAENLVKSAQEQIVELDKKIAEIKVEDFMEDALRSVDWERSVNLLRSKNFRGFPVGWFGSSVTGI